jgi:hypothetical protein
MNPRDFYNCYGNRRFLDRHPEPLQAAGPSWRGVAAVAGVLAVIWFLWSAGAVIF